MFGKYKLLENLELALHKERQKSLDFCKEHKRVFLYGAGRTAIQLIDYLQKESIIIAGIIVSDGNKTSNYLEKINIIELNGYDYIDGDGIILAVAEKIQSDLLKQLVERIGKDIKNHVYMQKIYSSGEATSEEDWYAGTRKDGTYFIENTTLENYGAKYGTDKSEKFHNYLHKYEFFVKKWKNEPIELMELGVFKGQSLAMWEEYFPNAKIIGVDIDENCKHYKNDKTEIVIMDLGKIENLLDLSQKFQPSIIVDDASHGWRDQILSLSVLFSSLKSGGIFIMEDLGTSFAKHIYSSENDACISGYDFLSLISKAVTGSIEQEINTVDKAILDAVTLISENVDMISFMYGACILIKR